MIVLSLLRYKGNISHTIGLFMLESENRTIRLFYFVHEQGFIQAILLCRVCRNLDSSLHFWLPLYPFTHTLHPIHAHTMDLGYRNRNHPAHQYQQEIVKTDLVHQTIQAIHQLLRLYPQAFDLNFLTPADPACAIPVEDAIRQLHKDTIALYRSRNVTFDSHWVRFILTLITMDN